MVPNDVRKELVKVVANIYTERHGFDNSKSLRSQYAEAIVNLFPSFKNPYSTTGGYVSTVLMYNIQGDQLKLDIGCILEINHATTLR